MTTFSELLFKTENFFTQFSSNFPNLAEDLIQLSRAIYNYSNAQRAQKVFHCLKRIHRTDLACKFQHAKNESNRLLLETRRFKNSEKNSTDFYEALKLVIRPVLLDLLKVGRACEKAFCLSKLKISEHGEWQSYAI